MDENFAKTFSTQQQFGKVLTIMATLPVLIASLGLLGMIVYSLEQRTKEIGIRKVSGASAFNILMLISKGYTKLILVAFFIGTPLAYYMMQFWLMDFANAITPSLDIHSCRRIYALACRGDHGYHAIKAALTNPVEVLRDESLKHSSVVLLSVEYFRIMSGSENTEQGTPNIEHRRTLEPRVC